MEDSLSLNRRITRLAVREIHPVPSSFSRVLSKAPMDRTWTPGHGVSFHNNGDASSNESIFADPAAIDMEPNTPSPPPTTTATQQSFVASSVAIVCRVVFILCCIKCSVSAFQQYHNTSLPTAELVTRYTSGTKWPESLQSLVANPYSITILVILGQVVMNKWTCIVGGSHAVT